MRHSWLTKFGVLCLNQLVRKEFINPCHGIEQHTRFSAQITWNEGGVIFAQLSEKTAYLSTFVCITRAGRSRGWLQRSRWPIPRRKNGRWDATAVVRLNDARGQTAGGAGALIGDADK